MTSQTRLPPIGWLLILPCDLIFLRRLSALFSRYSGVSEAGRWGDVTSMTSARVDGPLATRWSLIAPTHHSPIWALRSR